MIRFGDAEPGWWCFPPAAVLSQHRLAFAGRLPSQLEPSTVMTRRRARVGVLPFDIAHPRTCDGAFTGKAGPGRQCAMRPRPSEPQWRRSRTLRTRGGTATWIRAGGSPLVRQELPVQGDDRTVARGVGLAPDVEAEVDGADDAVAELLVDELLDRRAVDLQDLVEPVNGRIGRDRRVSSAPRVGWSRSACRRPCPVRAAEAGRRGLVRAHQMLSQ